MHRSSLKTGILRLIATLTLALTIAGVLAPAASATWGDGQSDIWIDQMVNQLTQACADAGGVSSVHYEFDTGGHLFGAYVNCIGQTGSWGDRWECGVFFDGTYTCWRGFTRPPEGPNHGVTAQDGTVVEAVDIGSESVPTPIVIDRATGGPDAPERPTATPETVPTDQNDERTP